MTFDQMRAAYEDQVRGLIDGGVDLLLLETIFDTLNAKAGIVAIENVFEEKRRAAAADDLGDDHRSQRPHAVGPDARRVLRVDRARAGRSASASTARSARATCGRTWRSSPRIAECYVSCYPNAGLPNAFGEYDELPDETGALLRDFAASGFVNIVGGCCGTTPDHIAAIAQAVEGVAPRPLPAGSWLDSRSGARSLSSALRRTQPITTFTRFSGLETLTIRPDSNFQMIGERTNVTGSARFARLIKDGNYAERGSGRRRAGAQRREPDRREHGRGHARLRAGDDDVPQLHRD